MLNTMRYLKRINIIGDIGSLMVYRRFVVNLTQRVGGVANYVFFTKFKMAEILSRRS